MNRRSFLAACFVAPFVPRLAAAQGVDLALKPCYSVVTVSVFNTGGIRATFHTRDMTIMPGRLVQVALDGMVEGSTSPPGSILGFAESVNRVYEIPPQLHGK